MNNSNSTNLRWIAILVLLVGAAAAAIFGIRKPEAAANETAARLPLPHRLCVPSLLKYSRQAFICL